MTSAGLVPRRYGYKPCSNQQLSNSTQSHHLTWDGKDQMTRSYQMLQLAVLLPVLTACPSSDPSLDSQFSSDSGIASLSWDASTGTDVAGYKIDLATASGAYGTPIATTSTDVTTYTITGLSTGTTYFFVVSAFNLDGTESTFSNEVSKVIP